MTGEELYERIAQLHKGSGATIARLNFAVDVELLISDCIAAVTPNKSDDDDGNDEFSKAVYNSAIDTIEANTKELLG